MSQRTVLITGGAGFIGSHLVKRFLKLHDYRILTLDKLTYAGHLGNLAEVLHHPNHSFVKGDICDEALLDKLFQEENISDVIHLAAESHVDRSIESPLEFVQTNVIGTVTLLNSAKKHWQGNANKRFHHVSTDEVFGSLGEHGAFNEHTSYDPRSPYSSSKASSDHFVRAYGHTYGMNTVISNCSNNYGPNQFPEKLIPLMINNIVKHHPLPVYGEGLNVRDWLWVEDHVEALDLVFHQGKTGDSYNIGGNEEWKNIDLVHALCEQMDQLLGRQPGSAASLITHVKDRAGHDLRYAIDASKIKAELNWEPKMSFENGLRATALWYLENDSWLDSVMDGSYRDYYERQYQKR